MPTIAEFLQIAQLNGVAAVYRSYTVTCSGITAGLGEEQPVKGKVLDRPALPSHECLEIPTVEFASTFPCLPR